MQAFTLDVTLHGPQLTGTRIANAVKCLLDGLVSCFHAHDGSSRDALYRLATFGGPPERTWQRLTDRSTAILGERALLCPYRNNTSVQWNPADHNCDAFRIRPAPDPLWSLQAELRPSVRG